MKGLILSGGTGSRLRPITQTGAKQLLPVANKPILFYGIESLRDAGIREIGIVVGETGEAIKAAAGTGERWGVKISYIQQGSPLGLAHAVKISENFLGVEPFVMYLGDNVIKTGLSSFLSEFDQDRSNSHILLSAVKNPQDYGVAVLKDGRVTELQEKPANPKSPLAIVGVYIFDRTIFKAVNAIKPSPRGELEITDAIQWLIQNGYLVKAHIINSWWKDTGTVESILEANRMFLEDIETQIEGFVDNSSKVYGRIRIGKNTKVINSHLRGPLVIGSDCTVVCSYIGPFTSISDEVTVKESEIEHSVVLDKSSILSIGGRIEDSLIGKNVQVIRTDEQPVAYRIIVGDNSTVKIK
jgi:glucose-1-phosphate thymidylyltransferase